MGISEPPSDHDADRTAPVIGEAVGLGPALRRAWVGYQLRLDEVMAAAGFGERRFPDGRVLRLCSGPSGSTISAIGREIGITRQGAAKVVTHLVDRGYVHVADSASSGREKSVTLTARGLAYLEAQRRATLGIEAELQTVLGPGGFSALGTLLEALAGDGEQVRMRDYLRSSAREEALMPHGSGQMIRQSLMYAKPWQRYVIAGVMIAGGAGLVALGHVAGALLAPAGALLIWYMLRYRMRSRRRTQRSLGAQE